MKIRLLILASVLFLIPPVSSAQVDIPKFRNYPVNKVFKGRNARVRLVTETDRMFRTRLRRAAKQKPNFAGRYVVTSWGCGTSCIMGAVVDVKTGKVYWWDFSICCWGNVDEGFRPIEFRKKSNLIIFSGTRNEGDNDYGSHFYKFENGKFMFIKTIERDDGMESMNEPVEGSLN